MRWWAQLSALLLIVIELIWVTAWYQTASLVSVPPPLWKAVGVLAGALVASYLVALAAEELRLIPQARLILLGGLLVVDIIAANAILLPGAPFRTEDGSMRMDPLFVINLVFMLWLWGRGIGLGSEIVRPMMAWRRFQGGMIALMAHALLVGVLDQPVNDIGPFILYLFCGLLAVILARIAYVSVNRSSRKNPFNRGWAVTVILILAVGILADAAVAGLVTGQFRSVLDALAASLAFLVAALIFIFSIPGLILVYLISPLLPLLREWANGSQPAATPDPVGIGAYPLPQMEVRETGPLPLMMQYACFWSIVALTVLVVFLAARRAYARRHAGVVEGPESLLNQGQARRLARQALDDFVHGLGRRLRPAPRPRPPARVRRIYADLLGLSAALRHPRPDGATPFEFVHELKSTFIGLGAEVETITRAYVQVRYGQAEAPEAEVEAVERAWGKLAAAGSQLKKNLPKEDLPLDPPISG